MIRSEKDYCPYDKSAAEAFLALSKEGMTAVFLYSGNVCAGGKITPYDDKDGAIKTIGIGGESLVPTLFFTRFLGGEFEGDGQKGNLSVNGKTLEVESGRREASLDGTACVLSIAPISRRGMLYLPLVETASLFGYEVKSYYENRLTVIGNAEHIKALDENAALANAGAYLVCGLYDPTRCRSEDYRAARLNWRRFLVGTPALNDMSVPAIAQKINDVSARCREKWETLNKNEDRVILWGDSAPTESADLMHQSLALADLAKGWGTYGSEYYHNEELYRDIVDAVWWLYYHMYGEDIVEGTGWRSAKLFNWYHWFTAFAENLTDVLFIMEDPDLDRVAFTLEDKRKIFKTWEWLSTFMLSGEDRSTVQGRTAIYAKVALTIEDPERMYAVYADYDMYLGLTEKGDGPRVDYTHWWHGFPYNICYGAHNIDRMMRVNAALSGTGLAFLNPKFYGWFNNVKYMYEPAMYKGQAMLALNGRFVSTSEMYMGAWILVRMMLMIGLFGEDEDNYIRDMIRRHADKPEMVAHMKDRGFICNCAELDKILAEPISPAKENYEYAHAWFTGDRAAWHRNDCAAAFSYSSKREAAYECINEQNMTGWHMGDGAVYLYTDYDRHQYDGVNFIYKNREIAYHLPGTTEDRRERAIRHITGRFAWHSSKSFAGSMSLRDRYLMCAMDFESYHFEGEDYTVDNGYGMGLAPHDNDLHAKKAWFCFDKEIVALGAGINSTMNSPVDTTVEHRRLVSEDCFDQLIGMGEKSEPLGKDVYEKRYTDPKWVCMEGHAGFYFPEGGNVFVRRYISTSDEESGVFGNNLEEGIRWEEAEQPFFEVRIEHGENPVDASYAYVVLPYATPDTLGAYAQNPNIEILSNTAALQAVREREKDIVGYVFHEAGAVEGFSVDKPMLVMTMPKGENRMEFKVSDPTRELGEATLTLDGEWGIVSCHERIRVSCENGKTTLYVNFSAANGRGLDVVLEKMPKYWRSSLDDVEETLKLVKLGKVSTIATSAGGRPIYQVEYGCSNVKLGTANLCSSLGANSSKYYADKSGADYTPTFLIDGAIHGGEFEGTVAILSLIKLMETGTDYRGEEHPELLAVMNRLHLILVPISNPDGRSRVPFRSFVGKTFYDLRYYNQGTWKDGTLCGWPGCKTVHPIKDASDFLGAYFTDDGINMMHEDYFSNNVCNETQALFEICRKEAPDFSVLLHGGSNATSCLVPYNYTTKASLDEAVKVSRSLKERCDSEGVRYEIYKGSGFGAGFMLCSAMHHLCGGTVITYESNQGLCDHGNVIYSYDEIYRSHLLLFEEIGKHLLEKYGKQKA